MSLSACKDYFIYAISYMVGGVGSYPLLSQAQTHVEVELGCDKNNAGASLWRLPQSIICRSLSILEIVVNSTLLNLIANLQLLQVIFH